MIEQNKCFIEIHQRVDDTWNYAAYVSGEVVHFKSIDLTLSVDEIFKNVDRKMLVVESVKRSYP